MSKNNLIIEMYRPSQYESWDEAARLGGIHETIAYTVDDLHYSGCLWILDDILSAIVATVNMMDGNEEVMIRLMHEQDDGTRTLCTVPNKE